MALNPSPHSISSQESDVTEPYVVESEKLFNQHPESIENHSNNASVEEQVVEKNEDIKDEHLKSDFNPTVKRVSPVRRGRGRGRGRGRWAHLHNQGLSRADTKTTSNSRAKQIELEKTLSIEAMREKTVKMQEYISSCIIPDSSKDELAVIAKELNDELKKVLHLIEQCPKKHSTASINCELIGTIDSEAGSDVHTPDFTISQVQDGDDISH